MRFKLTYLALAVLVVAIGITVWVEWDFSRQNQRRAAMRTQIDAAAAKLNVRAEIIYCDENARQRLHRIRSWAYQERRSRDRERWGEMEEELPPGIEPALGPGLRSGTIAAPTSQPDEFQAFGMDDGAAEIDAAAAACGTVKGWYERPGDEVGDYLRRFPEAGAQRLKKLLLRLLDSDDSTLLEASALALFAMGDRSAKLRNALEFALNTPDAPSGGLYAAGSLPPPPPPSPDWVGMLRQFDGWEASTRAASTQASSDDNTPEFAPQSSPADRLLPPGVMYALGETRFHHGQEIASVDFSPDGKTLLTANAECLCLWDVADGRLKSKVKVAFCELAQASFLPDGRVLILANGNQTTGPKMFLWTVGEDTPKPVARSCKRNYAALSIAPDGKTLAVREADCPAVQLFELPSLRPLHRLIGSSATPARPGGESPGFSIAFSPDSKTLVYRDQTRQLIVFDVATGERRHDWPLEIAATEPAAEGAPAWILLAGASDLAVDNQNRAILLEGPDTVYVDLATGKKEMAAGKTHCTARCKRTAGSSSPLAIMARTSSSPRITQRSAGRLLAAGRTFDCLRIERWRHGGMAARRSCGTSRKAGRTCSSSRRTDDCPGYSTPTSTFCTVCPSRSSKALSTAR